MAIHDRSRHLSLPLPKRADSASTTSVAAAGTLIVALLSLAIFLPGLSSHDLWSPDEPRYAEVAREMLVRHEFLVPHFNGELYTHKPPLQFWAICVAAAAHGRLDELAVRLPAALSQAGTTVLVFLLAGLLFSRRAAWLAALAYAINLRVFWQAHSGQIDSLLVFFTTLAAWFWLRSYLEAQPRLMTGFWISTALATLAKGPVGLVPLLLSIVVFLLWRHGRTSLRTLRPGRGLALWAGVVAIWLVPAVITAGGGYLRELLFTQSVIRYFSPAEVMTGHLRSWYYFSHVILTNYVPWSLFLPAALYLAWKQRRCDAPGPPLLLCWIAVTIVFFSLSSAKRSVYVLPIYPAIALLTGWFLDRAAKPLSRWSGHLRWPLGLLAAATLATLALAPRYLSRLTQRTLLENGFDRVALLVLLLLATGCFASFFLARRRGDVTAPLALAATVVASLLVIQLALLPRLDDVRSVRPLVSSIDRWLADGQTLGCYPACDGEILFYSRRYGKELGTVEELNTFALNGGTLVAARRKSWDRIRNEGVLFEEALGDGRIERGHVLLVATPQTATARLGQTRAPGRASEESDP